MKAKTIVEISGRCIETIPAGTEFTIIAFVPDYAYATCRGLGVSSIWNWEYELIKE